MQHRFLIINLAAAIVLAVGSATGATEERQTTLRGGQGVVVVEQQNDRNLQFCPTGDQKIFKLDITSGVVGEYKIEQYDNGSWNMYPDASGATFANQSGTRRICVAPGNYRLTISGAENASYTAYLKGKQLKNVSGRGDKTVLFDLDGIQLASPPPPPPPATPMPTPQPTPNPTPQVVAPYFISGRIADCESNEHHFKFEIQVDAYGEETTWDLKNKQGTILLSNGRSYGAKELDSREICLPPTSGYILTVRDPYDGLCCDERNSACPNWNGNSSNKYCFGYYKIEIDGKEVLRGGEYIPGFKKHTFNLEPHAMTERDQQWLTSHNDKRQKWHSDYGKSYVPLRWSNSLKKSAQNWAEELLKTCGTKLYHEGQSNYGENLASNFGTGSFAALTDTDNVLGRFVDWERDWEWPRCAHLTQVLWRGSHHVGCADASIVSNGMTCHVQVCRYARAGNCNMNSFNDGSNKWWMDAVMNDDPSRCGAECPVEGCHYY